MASEPSRTSLYSKYNEPLPRLSGGSLPTLSAPFPKGMPSIPEGRVLDLNSQQQLPPIIEQEDEDGVSDLVTKRLSVNKK